MLLDRTFERLQSSGGNKIADFLAGGANPRISAGVNGKQNIRAKYVRVGLLNGAARRRRTDVKRLTTNDENHILASLNLFYCKDNEVWIRGGGPEPDYADCTLVDWIVSAAEKHHLDIFSRDAEGLGEEMYDSMQFGSDTIEGIVALLHAAAIQAAEMRGHLAAIEDILGDEYDLDRLRELAQADREGRCVVLPAKTVF